MTQGLQFLWGKNTAEIPVPPSAQDLLDLRSEVELMKSSYKVIYGCLMQKLAKEKGVQETLRRRLEELEKSVETSDARKGIMTYLKQQLPTVRKDVGSLVESIKILRSFIIDSLAKFSDSEQIGVGKFSL